jgi:hypothetical protein
LFGVYLAWALWQLWRAAAGDVACLFGWVFAWYITGPLTLSVFLGPRSRMTRVTVGYALLAPPVIYALQSLDDLPKGWLLVYAMLPLVAAIFRTYSSLSSGGRREVRLQAGQQLSLWAEPNHAFDRPAISEQDERRDA